MGSSLSKAISMQKPQNQVYKFSDPGGWIPSFTEYHNISVNYPELVKRVVINTICIDNGVNMYINGNLIFNQYQPENSNHCPGREKDITSYVRGMSNFTIQADYIIERAGNYSWRLTIYYQ